MSSESLMKNSLIIYAILFFALISIASPTSNSSEQVPSQKDVEKIAQILNARTNGNDPLYSKVLSPALSLEVDKNKSARAQKVNDQIIFEMQSVITAFKSAPEDQKAVAVRQTISSVEPELIKNDGVYITFFDSNPSAAFSRTFLLVSKKNSPGVTAKDLFSVLLSYKRSAKPNDHVFEYPQADNLTVGPVKYTLGNENTWKGTEAALPLILNQDIAIKKCRQLLGWRCVTSLYHAESFLKTTDATNLLFISTYDITNNPDFPDFARDKRGINQITGSSAIYIVKESINWIMLFGVDAQWNDGKLSFQGAIQKEFKKDFERFKERISFDLKVQL